MLRHEFVPSSLTLLYYEGISLQCCSEEPSSVNFQQSFVRMSSVTLWVTEVSTEPEHLYSWTPSNVYALHPQIPKYPFLYYRYFVIIMYLIFRQLTSLFLGRCFHFWNLDYFSSIFAVVAESLELAIQFMFFGEKIYNCGGHLSMWSKRFQKNLKERSERKSG